MSGSHAWADICMQASSGTWLLTVLLSLWWLPEGLHGQQAHVGLLGGRLAVEDMLPLFETFRAAGISIGNRKPPLPGIAWADRPLDIPSVLSLVSEALVCGCR